MNNSRQKIVQISQGASTTLRSVECKFFDVPVYRISEEQYYSDMCQHIDALIFPHEDPLSTSLRENDLANPAANALIRRHLAAKYGGCWQFNEIVGYLRLFVLGSQVRGDYFSIGRERIRRTRCKVFEQSNIKLVQDIDIVDVGSNEGIFDAVLESLDCARKALKGRYIDSECIEKLGRHIDWQSFLQSNSPDWHLPPNRE